MAYVPPDPSQPLPEEPDTQDLEDEYANVRDALARRHFHIPRKNSQEKMRRTTAVTTKTTTKNEAI